jgi:(p)ppGpp synthase/HD superfamily hydrolase
MPSPPDPIFAPDLFARALRFAAQAHGDQRVPGSGHPYVVHLALVAHEAIGALAADPTLDATVLVPAALLHDVLEDTETSPEAIRATFGESVLLGVQALSKDPRLPKERRFDDSLDRLALASREAQVVKLADRTANLLPPPQGWSTAKIEAYREEARRLLVRLGPASPVLAARLADRIARYPHTAP